MLFQNILYLVYADTEIFHFAISILLWSKNVIIIIVISITNISIIVSISYSGAIKSPI